MRRWAWCNKKQREVENKKAFANNNINFLKERTFTSSSTESQHTLLLKATIRGIHETFCPAVTFINLYINFINFINISDIYSLICIYSACIKMKEVVAPNSVIF